MIQIYNAGSSPRESIQIDVNDSDLLCIFAIPYYGKINFNTTTYVINNIWLNIL